MQKIKNRKIWVGYNDKKVPIQINGLSAKPNDRSTWDTYENVKQKFGSKVGFMFDGTILGVDFDHIVENGKIIDPVAEKWLQECDTYTEYSPSGTGVHAIFLLTEPLELNNKSHIVDKEKGMRYEYYSGGRYFSYTGSKIGDKEVKIIDSDEVVNLLLPLGYKIEREQYNESEDEKLNRPGDWYNRNKKWEEVFADTEWKLERMNGDVGCWRRPGKTSGISATTNWNGKDNFHVFTASNNYFDAGKSYSKFAVYAILYHGGNFKKAAQEITKRYPESKNKSDSKMNDKNIDDEDEKTSQKMQLMEMVTENPDVDLFKDEYDRGQVRIKDENRKVTMACSSEKFKNWLINSYLERFGNIPDPGAVNSAIGAINSKAMIRGESHKLHSRIAKIENEIWYDLADKNNKAIKITENGWEIVEDVPTIFRRSVQQEEQVVPVKGGDLKELFKYVNVTDPVQQLLLQIYLVSCFIPGFPHVLIYIHGEQGSAKTTLSRFIRRLVDPSKIEVVHMPKDPRELKIQLSKNYMIFYENVDGISTEVSSVLCIGVTGGSSSERELFTNGEEFILNFQTMIGINGINISAIKPDLLERSLLFGLRAVEEQNRKDEHEINQGFEEARPRIFGAILDTVSKALKIRPSIKLTSLPRMADFTLWGSSISEALGYVKEEFLNAYNQKNKEQSEEALMQSPEATALISFMEFRTEWKGTAQELLDGMFPVSTSNSASKRVKIPRTPQNLTRRLNELKPNLKKIGVLFETGGRENGERVITIEKIGDSKHIVQSVQDDFDKDAWNDNDDVDDENGSSIPF